MYYRIIILISQLTLVSQFCEAKKKCVAVVINCGANCDAIPANASPVCNLFRHRAMSHSCNPLGAAAEE